VSGRKHPSPPAPDCVTRKDTRRCAWDARRGTIITAVVKECGMACASWVVGLEHFCHPKSPLATVHNRALPPRKW